MMPQAGGAAGGAAALSRGSEGAAGDQAVTRFTCQLAGPQSFQWLSPAALGIELGPGQPKAMPRPHKLDEVEQHRRSDCARSDACLALAAEGNWRGWSCAFCDAYLPVHEAVPAMRAPRRRNVDRPGLAALDGQRRRFDAELARFGRRRGRRDGVTLLLKSVWLAATRDVVAEHVWMRLTAGVARLGELRAGTVLAFNARVTAYFKNQGASYRLSRPSGFEVVQGMRGQVS